MPSPFLVSMAEYPLAHHNVYFCIACTCTISQKKNSLLSLPFDVISYSRFIICDRDIMFERSETGAYQINPHALEFHRE